MWIYELGFLRMFHWYCSEFADCRLMQVVHEHCLTGYCDSLFVDRFTTACGLELDELIGSQGLSVLGFKVGPYFMQLLTCGVMVDAKALNPKP